MANLMAIFLQTLCIKLGTVTGLNLAQCCRLFLPRWMNYCLYFFAEAAIIATDIAEVCEGSSFFENVSDDTILGDRVRYRVEPPCAGNSSRGWMCNFHPGCHAHTSVLQSSWLDERA
jgi:hypothetical protein